MRVLVIDATPGAQETAEALFSAEDIGIEFTSEGEEGVFLSKHYDFDAITLDLKLQDITGFETLRQIRRAGVRTPVIVITEGPVDRIRDTIRLLAAGADDYMTAPVDTGELVARIRALVRRSAGLAQSIIKTGRLSIDLYTRVVRVDGEKVAITGKEYALIELLSLRKERVMSREAIMMHLYGGRDEPEIKIIDVFVCKIRKKLEEASGGEYFISTGWGEGYVLRDPDKTSTVDMSSEVADLADDPPTGYVPNLRYPVNAHKR